MPNIGSPFPTAVPPRNDVQQDKVSVQAEPAPGEVALDALIRQQSSAPQIVKRIAELENCIWALSDYLHRRCTDDEAHELIQRAKEVLKSRVEIDDLPANGDGLADVEGRVVDIRTAKAWPKQVR